MRIKDRLYYHLVEKNDIISQKYNEYVEKHITQHKKARLVHWIYLLGLNIRYYGKTQPKKTQPKKTQPKKPSKGTVSKSSMPYTGGSESNRIFISKEIHFAKKLMKYDVISFDVFDTLIFRTFCKPTDVFSIVGKRLNILNFEVSRIAAEKEAREAKKKSMGTIEVSLDEIYEVLGEMLGIDAKWGAEVELEVEKELVHANPYMLRVFDLLKAQEKTIIAVSDMYMNGDEIRVLLEKCGYIGIEKVYSSADFLCSKSNGKLFNVVQWDFEGKSIVHIGDNYKSDCTCAKEQGLESYYYRNVNMLGKEYRPSRLNSLVGSVYCALLNEKYYCGLEKYSPLYEIGYSYVGLYILGYVNWIHEYAKKYEIDKILFLARDGDIYKQVYDKFYSDIDAEYVYWSRSASIKCDVPKNWNMFMMHFIDHKEKSTLKSELGVLFDNLGIGALKKYFADYMLFERDVLDSTNILRVKKLITMHKEEVIACYQEEHEALKEYILSVVGQNKRIILVDIGWSGSVLLPMKEFIQTNCNGVSEVHCLMSAGRPLNSSFSATAFLDGSLKTYMFSPEMNKDLFEWHKNKNKGLNTFFVELLTQSSSPSFIGINKKEFIFDIPEVENYEKNSEVHKGILEFAVDYMQRTETIPSLRNISGYDAYLPIMHLLSKPEIIYKFMGEYSFGRSAITTSAECRMETVKEVVDKQKIFGE